MGRNLGPLNIKDSYEGLVQISGSNQLTDGSGSLISSLDIAASTATSASYATTASFALNVPTIDSGSFMVTGSVTDDTLTFTKGDGSTFDLVVDNVASASFATTAQTASFLPSDTNLNINSITASFASFTSASIGSLRTVTGSAVIIGDEFIILNADTPTARYAGIRVYDSGSGTPATASLEWDGLSDNWILVEESGNSGVLLTGPTGSKGTEILPTVNTLQKGGGHHTLIDSSISDDGTLVTIDAGLTQGKGGLTNSSDKGAIIGANGATLSGNTTGQAIAGGDGPAISGRNSFIGGGSTASITVLNSGIVAGRQNKIQSGQRSFIGGGNANEIKTSAGDSNAILGGSSNDITAGTHNAIVAGTLNVNTHIRSVIVGGTGLSTSKDDEVVVPSLTATNISSSGYVSASTFIGDGSQLSGISTTPFPYTGSAEITGSLDVIGPVTSGNGTNSVGTNGNEVAIGGNNNNVTGNRSAAIGGYTNSVTGGSSVMIGGRANTLSGDWSTIAGGQGNTASGYTSTVIGSETSTASNSYAFIAGAVGGTANQSYAVIVGGQNHRVTANSAGIFGGFDNDVSGARSVAIGGTLANIDHARSVTLGGTSLATTKDDEAVVNHLSIYGDAIVDNGTTTGNVIDNIGQTAASSEDAVKHIIHLTQAEYDALTPDANTLYVIEGAETLGDTEIDGQLTGVVNTLTDVAGTTALDCSVGNYFTLAMPAGGTTELLPSNITAGQTINIKIQQNGTPSTLTYDNAIEFAGGTAFTISTGAGEVDILTLVAFDATTMQATGLANFS